MTTRSIVVDALGNPGNVVMDYLPKNKILSKSMVKRTTKPRYRRSRRRRFYRKRNTLVQPYSITRKLCTTMRSDINPAASSAITAQVFGLNAAYDPTLSVSGQQPLGFDQHMALYQNYCVVGYKIRVDVCSSDNTYPIVFGFTPMTTSTALTDPSHYIETKGTVHRIMTPDVDKLILSNKGGIKRWLMPQGGKMLTNDSYWGNASGNPTSLLYGHLWASSLAGAGVDPSIVTYIIKIEQIVKFFNPIVPARS